MIKMLLQASRHILFPLLLLAVTGAAQAQLALGRDYVVVEPAQATDNPAKVEVIEFFSYACPHCNDLNPLITQWAAKQPADVDFKKVPVSFDPFYRLMARLYYSLEAVGQMPKLDAAVFSAIHEKGLKLIDDKSIADWAVSQGVDARKFSEAWNSFGVDSKVKRANQLAQAAKIRGVPALFVDGRYLVVGQDIKSQSDLLALTDKVIAKARSEHKGKK